MIGALAAHKIIGELEIPNNFVHIEEVSLSDSTGLFLAEDLYATRDQPPFNRSMMDGISISSKNIDKGRFKKESIAKAGSPQETLKDDLCCIEIMTGAPLPIGCDTVIPYEEVIDIGESFKLRDSGYKINPTQFVHTKSSDYKNGDKLLGKGVLINSSVVSLLASIGKKSVKVLRLGKIAVISTGDELISPGENVDLHQVYRSNPFAIRSEILSFFPMSDIELFHINDNKDEVLSSLRDILHEFSLVIISGGVSKGKYDFIPSSLKELGVKELFHKVKQRPGKPLWFGVGEDGQVVFGLPGNPVSSLVNTRRHIISYLERCIAMEKGGHFQVRAAQDMDLKSDFTFFVPVKLSVSEGVIFASPSVGNNSGDFSKLMHSKGIMEVPEGSRKVEKGKLYDFYPWGSLELRL